MASLGSKIVPSLLARDIAETLRFYQSLGFRVTGQHPTDTPAAWVEMTRDGVTLQFYSEPPVGTPDQPILSGTLYLSPDGVDALAAEWHDKVAFEWGPETMDYGMREFAIRDPNGYLIAFAEPD